MCQDNTSLSRCRSLLRSKLSGQYPSSYVFYYHYFSWAKLFKFEFIIYLLSPNNQVFMLEFTDFLLNFQNQIHNPLFWNSPGKNTRVGNHCLLQEIFLTWESDLGLLHCRKILYHLSYREAQLNNTVWFSCEDSLITLLWKH